jgi:hypothetical protein
MNQTAAKKINPEVEVVEKVSVEELGATAKARLRRHDAADRTPRVSAQTQRSTELHLVAVQP